MHSLSRYPTIACAVAAYCLTVMLSASGCVGDAELEIIRDAEPIGNETEGDVSEETRDAGDFTGCNPFTAVECSTGEKCAISATGELTCTESGEGDQGAACFPGLQSDCGVGTVCANTESGFACCAPFCRDTNDCEGQPCLIIAELPEGELGYCAGVCSDTSSP